MEVVRGGGEDEKIRGREDKRRRGREEERRVGGEPGGGEDGTRRGWDEERMGRGEEPGREERNLCPSSGCACENKTLLGSHMTLSTRCKLHWLTLQH